MIEMIRYFSCHKSPPRKRGPIPRNELTLKWMPARLWRIYDLCGQDLFPSVPSCTWDGTENSFGSAAPASQWETKFSRFSSIQNTICRHKLLDTSVFFVLYCHNKTSNKSIKGKGGKHEIDFKRRAENFSLKFFVRLFCFWRDFEFSNSLKF